MNKAKPIELMHLYYGVDSEMHFCGTCCNIVEICRGGKKFRKCKAYGITCSTKSDFAKKWNACGLYGKNVPYQIISDDAKRFFSRCGIVKETDSEDKQVNGQVGIFK